MVTLPGDSVTVGLSRQQREILREIAHRADVPWPMGRPAGAVHSVYWPLTRHPSPVLAASRSRALRRLEARGLVVRHRGRRDTYRVSLTPAGLAAATSVTAPQHARPTPERIPSW